MLIHPATMARTVVPMHSGRTIKEPLLRAIVRDARLTVDEFLELLWVLEAALSMEPQLSAALDAVVASECFEAEDLPQPTEAERRAPGAKVEAGGLLSSMDADDLDGDDE